MMIILLIAATISIIINPILEAEHREIAWVEGFAIFFAVFFASIITATFDYKKEKVFI